MSLKESSRLVEEAKEREVQMQNKFRAMEQQVKVLTERDQEVSSVLRHNCFPPPNINCLKQIRRQPAMHQVVKEETLSYYTGFKSSVSFTELKKSVMKQSKWLCEMLCIVLSNRPADLH